MSADLTTLDAIMKNLYPPGAVEDETIKENPLLGMMEKDTEFYGRNLTIPIIYGRSQARSAGIGTAITKSTSSTGGSSAAAAFVISRVKDYAIAELDNEFIEASANDEGAFIDGMKSEGDGAINSISRSISTKQYRSGWGDIGTVSSYTTAASAGVITLATASDAVNFEYGMDLLFASTQSTSTVRTTSVATVTGVDELNGLISTNATLNTAITTGDYIFLDGDRQNSTAPTALAIFGLESWIPYSTSGLSTAFNGVTRSNHVQRLAGYRLNGASLMIEECLSQAARLVGRGGGKITDFFMPHAAHDRLIRALHGRVQYTEVEATANVFYRAVRIQTPVGEVRCHPDVNCPANRIFGLNLNHWKLYSLGAVPHVIDSDGLMWQRTVSTDKVQGRWGYYAQMGCNAPGRNVVIQITPA